MSDNSKRLAVVVTVITFLCKMFGFFKNSILAYYYGTSPVVDAYVMTFSIGTITSGWIAGLIGNFTPKYQEIQTVRGHKKAILFSSQVINLIVFLVVALVIMLEIFSPHIVKIVAPGFTNETYYYTVYYFRIYCISVPFYALFRFFQEFLNCNQNHLAAVAPDLLMSSMCIIAIIISHYIGSNVLILGYVFAIVAQSIATHLSSRKIGFNFRVTELWNKDLKSLMVMAIPIFLSDTLANINNLIDKVFASKLESGIVSALDYANTMKDFAYQIGTIAISIMVFPVISKLWAENDYKGFNEKVVKGLDFFSAMYIPLVVGIVVAGDLVIHIVFGRGAFSEAAGNITSNAFIIYSISLLAMTYRCIFLKAFYAMQKTSYILLVSFSNVLLNVILNFALVRRYGYIGLTFATTIAAVLCLPIYFVLFRRMTNVSYKLFACKFARCLICAGIMGSVIYFVKKVMYSFWENSFLENILLLVLILVVGAIVYVCAGVLFKIDEVVDLLSYIIRKIKHNIYKD